MTEATVRVLFVGDRPGRADAAAPPLTDRDRFTVETKPTADDVVDRATRGPVDCLVTEQDLPTTSGLALLERVREADADLPFVLCAPDGSEQVASRAVSAGVTEYFPRASTTVDADRLADCITEAVERARARTAARRDRDQFRALSSAFPDVAFYIGEDGRYVDVLAGEESPLLYDDPETFLGKRFHDVLPTDTADRFLATVERALQTDTLQTIEYPLDVQAGERWFEARIVPLETRLADERAVIWVARDVTERKEREQRLERQNDRLEEFADVVSHDLRNPMQVLETRLALAERETDGEVAHLGAARTALDRMQRIVDDMLWLAHEGADIGATEPVALREAVEQSWMVSATGRSDATLSCPDGWDPTIEADDDRVRQLLENLLRNAVEHGGTDVTVRVEPIDGGFAVADDGPGIPPEKRERIFENGHSSLPDGTGFGLNIVSQVAAAHGWDVRVCESGTGGARFEITGVTFVQQNPKCC